MRIKYLIFNILILVFFGCSSIKYNTLYSNNDYHKIEKLKRELISIGGNKEEAEELATLAIIKSKELANSYNLVSPPIYHNFLVNSGQRKKGLCYHFVEDLYKEIKSRNFKSFKFKWGRANANKLNEHNVIVVLSKNTPWGNGIILDAWRNSGKLYFNKVKSDKKYHFIEWKEGNRRLN